MGSAERRTKKRTRKLTKPTTSTSKNRTVSIGKTEQEEIRELQNMMDADSKHEPLLMGKGRNPYLTDCCLLCRCKRPPTESIPDESNGTVKQIPLWVCNDCKKAVEDEDRKTATAMSSLRVSMEEELKDNENFAGLESSVAWSSSGSGSGTNTPNGTICNCEACNERRLIMSQEERETSELQNIWKELQHMVRCIYREAGTGLAGDSNSSVDTTKSKQLVNRLAVRDPHQLFQRLESQGREYVIEMKVRLLKQLTGGHKTPAQAREFVAMLLEEYAQLCAAAKTLASVLTELMGHLKRFNLTWELHDKHLFQSIIYSDPVVQNSLPILIAQLRYGAASKEFYHEETFPNVLHHFLKFDDEMTVVSVVWRDCEQLIENYNDEQAAMKAKQKMLQEDWELFRAQRKLLNNSPAVSGAGNNNDAHHLYDDHFSENMLNLFKGSKSNEDCLCPNCNRKRCPCDECSISHMLCGIITSQVPGDPASTSLSSTPPFTHMGQAYPSSSMSQQSFASLHTSLQQAVNLTVGHGVMTSSILGHHDPRYVIDVTPPSMSSTSDCSDGSESPITVPADRLNSFHFDSPDCRLSEEIEEVSEELDDCAGGGGGLVGVAIADSDDDSTTDEGEEKCEVGEADSPASPTPSGERQQGDGQEGDDSLSDGSPPSMRQDNPCDCAHCVDEKLASLAAAAAAAAMEKQCQCYACLQQRGQSVSTALPHQLPPAPHPAAFHFYPHIHGAISQPQHLSDIGHSFLRRSVLQPQLYELHDLNTTNSAASHDPSTLPFLTASLRKPEPLDTHWDWDPTSKLLFGGQKYGGTIGSELFNVSTPPLLTGNTYLGADLTGVVDNSFANLIKTSTVLQQCVSASKPLTTTTVTTSTGITTSITGFRGANDALTDAHNKILKVSKALLKQQQQNNIGKGMGGAGSTSTSFAASSQSTATSVVHSSTPFSTSSIPASSTAFTFGLPPSPNKNKASPPAGLGAFTSSTGLSLPFVSSSALQHSLLAGGLTTESSAAGTSVDFSFKHPFTSHTSAFSCPPPPPPPAQLSPNLLSSIAAAAASTMPQTMTSQPLASSLASAQNNASQHQVKLNPDFIRAAAALQKAISEQSAAQHQKGGAGAVPGFQAFQNLSLQQMQQGAPLPPSAAAANHGLLTCTHSLSHNTGTGTLQSPGSGCCLPASAPHHTFLPTGARQAGGTVDDAGVSGGGVGEDEDSIEDSCSEKSSSTSTSNNQKDSKYCDCCYCEFFGQSTPSNVPQHSRSIEMRERLKKRLKNREQKPPSTDPPTPTVESGTTVAIERRCEKAMGLKDVDELLRYINGGEEGGDTTAGAGSAQQNEASGAKSGQGAVTSAAEKKSSKAAKRARQKQRKAEEKARNDEEARNGQEQNEFAKEKSPGGTEKGVESHTHRSKNPFHEHALKLQEHLIQAKQKDPQGTGTFRDVIAAIQGPRNKSEEPRPTTNPTSDNPKPMNNSKNSNNKQSLSKTEEKSSVNVQKTEKETIITEQKEETGKKKGKQKEKQNSAVESNTKVAIVKEVAKQASAQANGTATNKTATVNKSPAQNIKNNRNNNSKNDVKPASVSVQTTTKASSQLAKADTSSKVTHKKTANLNSANSRSSGNGGNGGGIKVTVSHQKNATTPATACTPTNNSVSGVTSASSSGAVRTSVAETLDNIAKPLLNGDIACSVSTAINRVKVKRGPKVTVTTRSGQDDGSGKSLPSPPPQLVLDGDVMAAISHLNNLNLSPQNQNKTSSASSSGPAKGESNAVMSRVSTASQNTVNVTSSASQVRNNTTQSQRGNAAPNVTTTNPQHSTTSSPVSPSNAIASSSVIKPVDPSLSTAPRQVRPNRPILHAARTLQNRQRIPLSNSGVPQPLMSGTPGPIKPLLQVPTHGGNQAAHPTSIVQPMRIPLPHGTSSAPATPDQSSQQRGGGARNHGNGITPSNQASMQLRFEQRSSVPTTPTKQRPSGGSNAQGGATNAHQGVVQAAKMVLQGKSRSEGSLSAPTTPRKDEQGSGRNKKNKKKNKSDELTSVDEIFLPKEETDLHEADEFEREIEEFKRFCLDSTPVGKREKIQVNVNLKDIFSKKRGNMAY